MMSMKDSTFFCSWSGGKDSCLALHHAVKEGGIPHFLLTMMSEDGERSMSHGLPIGILQKQAQALDIPLIVNPTSWGDYEEKFISTIREFKKKGIKNGVFGAIDVDIHREWVEMACYKASIFPYIPLWKKNRRSLLAELIDEGFRAVITSVKERVMDRKFLGMMLDMDVIDEVEALGIDVSGEEGEYHTVVVDGPIFSFPIELEYGNEVVRDGYRFLNIDI